MSGNKLRLALVQMAVGMDKSKNIANAVNWIRKAAVEGGANVVALPEAFNSPYGNEYFADYAEVIPDGPTTKALSDISKELKIHVIGGSYPEKRGDKLFNTCTVHGPTGDLLTKYSKVHLFDIDIPGKITFKESDSLTSGNCPAAFRLGQSDWRVGLGICYDMRFPDFAVNYANQGCQLLIYPGAFNLTTGPAHWELLCRARAVDNQLFVCAVSPATNEEANYKAWGHSSIVDPWGNVLAKAGHGEELLLVDLDLAQVEEIRSRIPIKKQRKPDIYKMSANL